MKTDDGIEVLVHIGLDTVTLNGEGFEQLIASFLVDFKGSALPPPRKSSTTFNYELHPVK